jgi:hypothetical protein
MANRAGAIAGAPLHVNDTGTHPHYRLSILALRKRALKVALIDISGCIGPRILDRVDQLRSRGRELLSVTLRSNI